MLEEDMNRALEREKGGGQVFQGRGQGKGAQRARTAGGASGEMGRQRANATVGKKCANLARRESTMKSGEADPNPPGWLALPALACERGCCRISPSPGVFFVTFFVVRDGPHWGARCGEARPDSPGACKELSGMGRAGGGRERNEGGI